MKKQYIHVVANMNAQPYNSQMNKPRSETLLSAVRQLVDGDQQFFKPDGQLNISAIADFVGLKQPTVFRNLTGRNEPSEATLEKFAQAFSVPIAFLRGEISEPVVVAEPRHQYLPDDAQHMLEEYMRLPVAAKRIIFNAAKALGHLHAARPELDKLLKDGANYEIESALLAALGAIYSAKSR